MRYLLPARRWCLLVAIACAWLFGGPPAEAQTTLRLDAATADTGDPVALELRMDHAGSPLSGWSFGVCHDPAQLTLAGVDSGPLLAIIKNGQPPDFYSLDLYGNGYTVGVVICFTGCATLPPSTNLLLNIGHYTVEGLAPSVSEVTICDTAGTPPVAVLVAVGGMQFPPQRQHGSVTVLGPTPRYFELSAGHTSVLYDPAEGIASTSIPVLVLEAPTNPTFPNPVAAFTLALRHPAVFLTPTLVEPGPTLAALHGGLGPDFFAFSTHAGGGVTVSCVTAASPAGQLLAPAASEIARVHYATVPSSLIGNGFGVALPLVWDPTVATPAVPNRVTVTGAVTGTTTAAGSIALVPREKFLRGDANDDGAINIADPLRVLGFLFNNQVLGCIDAADANDSQTVDIADAVTLLALLFAMGPPLPAPYPGCGFDPGSVSLCSSATSCP